MDHVTHNIKAKFGLHLGYMYVYFNMCRVQCTFDVMQVLLLEEWGWEIFIKLTKLRFKSHQIVLSGPLCVCSAIKIKINVSRM